MTNLKHIGIYVKDIKKQTYFYENVFMMKKICEEYEDSGKLYDVLFQNTGIHVLISKLITSYGEKTGQGEMIELIKVVSHNISVDRNREVYDYGLSHFSIGVENIEKIVELNIKHEGKKITPILQIGNRKCCFCKEPEGNVIELIQ